MKSLALVFLCFIFSFCCQTAKANPAPACVSGSLSSIIAGGPCDIGSLQFTFGGLSSKNYSFNSTTGTYLYNSPWTASMFDFTALSNGFTISFLGGPQSITARTNGTAIDDALLFLSVVGLGVQLTGETVSGGTLGGLTGSSLSYAYYRGQVICSPHCSSLVYGYTEVFLADGTLTSFNRQNQLHGKPFSSGAGFAIPFII